MTFDFGQYVNSGAYFKFKEPGDSITGQIVSIVQGEDFNGNPIPVLELDTNEGEVNVSAAQVMLRTALADASPEVGNEITIEFTGLGYAKPGRSAAKLFTVTIH